MSSIPNSKDPTPSDKLRGNPERSDTPEEALWSGSFSAKSMIGTWLILALITIGAIVALSMIAALKPPTVRNAVLIVLAVLWVGAALQLVYRKLANSYELTNQRLKHRDGILIRQNNRVEVIDIDDVSFTQGIIETMLNVGTIRIRSSDTSHPELVLRGISNVKYVSDLMDDARRTERRKRGLYVESI